jgi:hypothetical protein
MNSRKSATANRFALQVEETSVSESDAVRGGKETRHPQLFAFSLLGTVHYYA